MITLYEKSTCSKCSLLNTMLEERGLSFTIVDFHKTPLTTSKLICLAKKLDLSLEEMLRKTEPVYKDLELATKEMSEEELATIMINNPNLIQRPIMETESAAIIARDTEKITEFLDDLM